jgi:hypothetical protein
MQSMPQRVQHLTLVGRSPLEEPLELTLLMPCLDEARTVGTCVTKARAFL